ncbi:MAG TPA: AAA family ATPase [Bacillota bacterium]|nr:AAA family ATPase [Bacillota bacterium]
MTEKDIRTIVFANQKGGVGKTTSCVNIAACAAKKGFKTLLIDCDMQGNATSGLGIDKRNLALSVYDVLINRARAKDAVVSTKIKNLDLIGSTISLVGAEIELVDEQRREFRLADSIESLKNEYDLIFIDCPPSLGLLTMNALCAADAVVVPLLCEFYSLEGLSQLTKTIRLVKQSRNVSLELLGVLVNMYDGRLNLTMQVMDQIKRFFPQKLFSTPIPRNVRISEAPSHGMCISDYDRYSKGSIAYSMVTDELLERAGKKAKA